LPALERQLEGVIGLLLDGLVAAPRARETQTAQPANEQ
jgi:hypothetical protein